MIQLSKNSAMFAAVQTKNSTKYLLYGFFMSLLIRLYLSKDIRLFKSRAYPYSYMSMVLGRTWEANSLSYLYTFHISFAMTKNNEICNVGNNSICTATSAHETCAVPLTGNPYQDIASHGFCLHGCQIRYHNSPNNNGNIITGVFNICGKYITAGASSYEQLIQYVVKKRNEYILYVQESRKIKKQQCILSNQIVTI